VALTPRKGENLRVVCTITTSPFRLSHKKSLLSLLNILLNLRLLPPIYLFGDCESTNSTYMLIQKILHLIAMFSCKSYAFAYSRITKSYSKFQKKIGSIYSTHYKLETVRNMETHCDIPNFWALGLCCAKRSACCQMKGFHM